jgi:4-hydroxyacetophenone monooxygenase
MTTTTGLDKLKALVSDRAALLKHLEHADTAPLLMVLVHLGGDPAWLERIQPHIKGPWSFHDETPDALRAELREALADVLEACAETGRDLPTEIPRHLLPQMLRACTGQDVPVEYFPMVDEEMDLAGTDPKTVPWRGKPDPVRLADFQVLVVGAGFSGVGMGIKLKEAGIPFTIIEKNDDVGGTWYENTYPGIGVDTANHFYSYSFDNNNDWDYFFAKGDEIEAYIRRNTERTSLRDNIRFSEEVQSLTWDEGSLLWHAEIRRKDGSTYTMTANSVVSAVGMLNRPKVPPIKGLENFNGPKFHTARWDHSVDYKGKRVGMIGTGASGMQVGPAIQPFVENLTIFQRSPHWAMLNPLYFETVTDAKKWVLNNILYKMVPLPAFLVLVRHLPPQFEG